MNHPTPLDPNQRYVIAYSGGLDSTVLLHYFAKNHPKTQLRAIHIHHGLQDMADSWAQHCQTYAQNLNISCEIIHVDIQLGARISLEAAARKARYRAFAENCNEHEILCLAQHQTDQAETFLLQALRGAGVAGLAGMAQAGNAPYFPNLKIFRPFLNLNKKFLQNYAEKHKLNWCEDPSNQNPRFARNWIRHEILPKIRERYPETDALLARSAAWCAESDELLGEYGEHLLAQITKREGDGALNWENLSAYSWSAQKLILRTWFAQHGVQNPEHHHFARIFAEVIGARQDSACPQVCWVGGRVWREKKWLCAAPFDPRTDKNRL